MRRENSIRLRVLEDTTHWEMSLRTALMASVATCPETHRANATKFSVWRKDGHIALKGEKKLLLSTSFTGVKSEGNTIGPT